MNLVARHHKSRDFFSDSISPVKLINPPSRARLKGSIMDFFARAASKQPSPIRVICVTHVSSRFTDNRFVTPPREEETELSERERNWGCSPLAGDGAVSRHRFRRHLEVAVTPVQETLPSLGQRLENEPRARRGAAATAGAAVQSRGAIFHVETVMKNVNSH